MTTLFQLHAAGVLGILALGIWLHLFFGRGGFWRVKKFDADRAECEELSEWPSVIVVVPARNEAGTIGQTIAGLIRQDYPGKYFVVVVDDHSEDGTANFARRVAAENSAVEQVRIVSAAALPAAWTGKVWALHEGVSSAAAEAPTYFWFTDADVGHAPDTLRRLVGRAERGRLDLTSLMVLLQAKTLQEQMLIPAFLYFFLKLYPPPWIADENANTAGAAGGCVLLRRETLERIGGLAAIRGEVIDDCALARAVKRGGGRIWMGLTRKSFSLRVYGSFGEIRDMIARTAFTQLGYSAALLLATLAGMFFIYLAPLCLLLAGDPSARVLGAIAWALMSVSFLPTVRFYRLSPLCVLFLPVAAIYYSYATWVSAARYWLGRGGQWKGRAQAHRDA